MSFVEDTNILDSGMDSEKNQSVVHALEKISWLRETINRVVVGQDDVVDQVIVVLLCKGHVLLEGVPGLGKTLLVKTLAGCFSGKFKRIQFTPDLMPSDMTGHAIYDMNQGKFNIRLGPIFTNLLLADEVNRSPAKTQAALLEVMQESQATIEGKCYPIKPPFMVLATQNPIEQDGTYPLPEAELDRFLLKVFIDYPSLVDEKILVSKVNSGEISMDAVNGNEEKNLHPEDIIALQKIARSITLDEAVLDYAVRLVHATRNNGAILKGAGPRASIGLVAAARAWALMSGRGFVLPDDIKQMAKPVMRHRILLAPDTEIEGFNCDQVIEQIIQSVEAPRE